MTTLRPSPGVVGTDRRVRIPKMAEVISERLRREIIEGALSEGDSLPSEKELMAEFGVSRPTLREAYRILESEQLIEIHRGANGGGRVHSPRVEVVARQTGLLLQFRGVSIAELFETRAQMEAPCAGKLARQRTGSDIAQLRQIVQDANLALKHLDSDQATLVAMQHRFHALICELAGNKAVFVLTAIVDSILDLADAQHAEARTGTHRMRRSFEQTQRQHEALVDLIEARDADGAETLWREHLSGSAAIVLKELGSKKLVDLFN